MSQGQKFQPVDINRYMMGGNPLKSTKTSNSSETTRLVVDNLEGFITQDKDFMIVTNQESNKPEYYSLMLDKDKIHLVEKSTVKKSEVYYYFKDKSIKLNSQPMNQDFVKEFSRKVEKIVHDLKVGKAKAYDKA